MAHMSSPVPTTLPALVGVDELYQTNLLVTPISIHELPASSGEFNRIFKVSHPPLSQHDGVQTSFLRLSKPLIPHRKTENEVASIAFARERLPHAFVAKCPKVLAFSSAPAFDAAPDSVHAFEWTILSAVPGVPLLDIFDPSNDNHIASVIGTVVELELAFIQSCRTTHLGGLHFKDGVVQPGPVVTFDMWDVEKLQHFADKADEHGQALSLKFEDWNPAGPFSKESGYIHARLERDLKVLRSHPACASLRCRQNDGKAFDDALDSSVRLLENALSADAHIDGASPGFALSHRDLHLGNFLALKEGDSGISISGILDWELAQCMPLDKWEPYNTLGSSRYASQTDAWRERLFAELNAALPGVFTRPASPATEIRETWWSFASLTYWIVYRTVNPEAETRQEQWLQRWWKLYSEIVTIQSH